MHYYNENQYFNLPRTCDMIMMKFRMNKTSMETYTT